MSIFNKPDPEIQVGLTGFATTTSSTDTFAITHPFYAAGGFKYSDDLTERDAILPSRRIPEITVVYVDSVSTWFQLQGGILNTDWVSLGANPFGGGTTFDAYKGLFVSTAALTAAHPTSNPGDYADVDTGAGTDAERYIWDDDDNIWVKSSIGTALTAGQVKTLYESNPDTNAFTDSDSTKLDGIEAGAEVNVNPDWNAVGGDAEILNKPTIPAAQVQSDWNETSGLGEILNKPIIPTATSELTNDSGFTDDQTGAEIEALLDAELGNTDWKTGGTGTTNLSYDSSTRTVSSDTGTDAVIDEVVAGGDSGLMTGADKTKLDGIETGATADQTDAEIRAAVDAATDSNVFTDADHTKLDGIEANAQVNVQSDWNEANPASDAFILNKPTIASVDAGYTPVTTIAELNAAIIDPTITNVVVQNVITGSLSVNTTSTTKVVGFPLNLSSSSITGSGGVEFYNTVTSPTISLGAGAFVRYRTLSGAVTSISNGTFEYEYADSTITDVGNPSVQTFWDNTNKLAQEEEYIDFISSTDAPVSKWSRNFTGPVTIDTTSLDFNSDVSSVSFETRINNGTPSAVANLNDLNTTFMSTVSSGTKWQVRAIFVYTGGYAGDGEATFKILR